MLQCLSVRPGSDTKRDRNFVAEHAEADIEPSRLGHSHAVFQLRRGMCVKRAPVGLVAGLGLHTQRRAGEAGLFGNHADRENVDAGRLLRPESNAKLLPGPR